jgi:glycolate oxidase iron-sulfur subunit
MDELQPLQRQRAMSLSFSQLKTLPLRVTYQDSCHLLHGEKVREAPRKLLRAIPGLDLAELPRSDIRCGSAAFTTLHKRKRRSSCSWKKWVTPQLPLQIRAACRSLRAGAEMHHANQKALHVIESLDQASTP